MRLFFLALFAVLALAAPAQAATASGTYTDEARVWSWSTWTYNSTFTQQPWVAQTPDDGARHPVVIYVGGTGSETTHFAPGDEGVWEGSTFAKGAAAKGFVGVKAVYDSKNTLYSGETQHATAIFGPQASSLVSKVCALPQADCSKGVFAVGHSQGGAVATIALSKGWVRAALGLGISGYPAVKAADPSRLRLIIGHTEIVWGGSGALPGVKNLTGRDCGAETVPCLQPDGSGYAVIQPGQVVDRDADHCLYWSGCATSARSETGYPWDPAWLSQATSWGYPQALDFFARKAG